MYVHASFSVHFQKHPIIPGDPITEYLNWSRKTPIQIWFLEYSSDGRFCFDDSLLVKTP